MKKKTVSLLLSLAVCLTMLPVQGVFAAETETETAAEASESTGNHRENLVIGTTSQPEGTSILTQQGSYGKFNYNSITYANLFYPDADNNMQPYFLDSYEISEDGCE